MLSRILCCFSFLCEELDIFGVRVIVHSEARAYEERFGLVGMRASDDEDDT